MRLLIFRERELCGYLWWVREYDRSPLDESRRESEHNGDENDPDVSEMRNWGLK